MSKFSAIVQWQISLSFRSISVVVLGIRTWDDGSLGLRCELRYIDGYVTGQDVDVPLRGLDPFCCYI